MKRLLLLRHAKSAPGAPGTADIDRPLAPRGGRAATLIGMAMLRERLVPDRIVCSSARRARETLAGVLPHLPGEMTIAVTSALYEPVGGTYGPAIAALGLTAGTLLVVGHNPAIQDTAMDLIGDGDPELIAEVGAHFTTGGLAAIDFEVEAWDEPVAGAGRLALYLRPRDLEPPETEEAGGQES